jgi:hypothetical protein
MIRDGHRRYGRGDRYRGKERDICIIRGIDIGGYEIGDI